MAARTRAPRAPRAPRVRKLYRLKPVSETPLLQAADLVTQMLKMTSTTSLDQLLPLLADDQSTPALKLAPVVFTRAQLALINEHRAAVALLRNKPTVSITECPVCGQVCAVAAAPARCTLTRGCIGKPVKSSVAKKELIPAEVVAAFTAPAADSAEAPAEAPVA